MKYEFVNESGNHRYEFVFSSDFPNYVDIRSYSIGSLGANAWMHEIKNGKIIWRNDDFMCLSKEAKDYVSKLVRLKAFL